MACKFCGTELSRNEEFECEQEGTEDICSECSVDEDPDPDFYKNLLEIITSKSTK